MSTATTRHPFFTMIFDREELVEIREYCDDNATDLRELIRDCVLPVVSA